VNLELEEFHALFFEEVGEHLTALEDGLLRLETTPDDRPLVDAIFRAAHSIKGTGGALGFNGVASFTHHMETVLDQMREHLLPVTPQRIALLLRATDALAALVQAARDGTDPPESRFAVVCELQQQLESSSHFEAEEPGYDRPSETGVERSAPLLPAGIAAQARQHPQPHCDTIRVSVAKVEELISLVGELVTANSIMQDTLRSSPETEPLLREALGSIDRTTRQLRGQLMSVRMVPIATLFRRFPRIVRDLAGRLGKSVVITITGEETELDKQMIDEIGDPLTHLIRNAVDHGLETRAQRAAQGKPAEGHIAFKAYQEGGNVVVEISDDGRGIDAARVRQKAISQGLIPADRVLTDEQAYQLIMLPGFSTAEKITDISGRGVGMDVVKRNVESLNGTIAISSSPGHGTCFRIKLPLSMSIMDGMAVRGNDDVYVLPLLSVVESLPVSPQHVVRVSEQGEIVLVRGEPIPLLRWQRFSKKPPGCVTSGEGEGEQLVVVVEHRGRKYGLVIEEMLGPLQLLTSMIRSYDDPSGAIAGLATLGDGGHALILDVAALTRLGW
jgi:two-component system chemotaxis sensor kinase CheA